VISLLKPSVMTPFENSQQQPVRASRTRKRWPSTLRELWDGHQDCSANSPEQGGSKARHEEMFPFVRNRTRGGIFSFTSTYERSLSEQLLELPLNGAVALARHGFQARAIKNGYVAIGVMDQASVFQSAGGDRHAGPADPQHH
jgi:hypothetical protein